MIESLTGARQIIHKLYSDSQFEVPLLSEMLDHTFTSIKNLSEAVDTVVSRTVSDRGALPGHGLSRADLDILNPLIHQIKEDYLDYLSSCLPNPELEVPQAGITEEPPTTDIQKRTHAA